ncbi:MAG: DUF6034 family protein [Clostridiales bacterium]|nr:DUF6034 family protein [Clostridiales bacterium]
MKRTLAIIIAPLLLIGSFACQPTPDAPIVMGKDLDSMIESAAAPMPNGTETKSIAEQVNAPAIFQYESTKGNLTITANAPVFVPTGSAMPIVQVRRGDFTQEQVDRAWAVLVGDAEMWEWPNERTKEELQADILYIMQQLESADFDPSWKEIYERRLAELQAEYQTAPMELAPQRADSKLKSYQQIDERNGQVICESMAAYGHNSQSNIYFSAENRRKVMPAYRNQYGPGTARMEYAAASQQYFGESTPKNRYELGLNGQLDESAAQFVRTSPADAKAQAEALIREMGLPMQVSRVNLMICYGDDAKQTPVYYSYSVFCTRDINGLPTAFKQGATYIEPDPDAGRGEATYSPTWDYELVEISINDSGISAFVWTAPLQLIETKVESSALLPYAEVQEIFERMTPITYELQAEGAQMTLEFTEVRLEMLRIVEQGSIENGLLIPVWNFYGVRHRAFKNGETDSTINYLLLCINAIDGSIIDTTKGY